MAKQLVPCMGWQQADDQSSGPSGWVLCGLRQVTEVPESNTQQCGSRSRLGCTRQGSLACREPSTPMLKLTAWNPSVDSEPAPAFLYLEVPASTQMCTSTGPATMSLADHEPCRHQLWPGSQVLPSLPPSVDMVVAAYNADMMGKVPAIIPQRGSVFR